MRLPEPRGPLSAHVVEVLRGEAPEPRPEALGSLRGGADALVGEDLHLALWMIYELHYRGFDDALDLEWDPATVAVRTALERVFEAEIRGQVTELVEDAARSSDDVVEQVQHVVDHVEGPAVDRYLQRTATRDQVLDFLAVRSLHHLKESDPHSFVLPRIDGAAKTALAKLQYDEYGAGRPEELQARLYGDALEAAGLDRAYGAYIERIPGDVLAVDNLRSLLAWQRRLRGAALGHLAASEVASSVPCRRIAAGIERVGLPSATAAYFHEDVVADAGREQVVLHDVCAAFVADEPAMRRELLLGVAACLHLAAVSGAAVLNRWTNEDTADERIAS